MISLKKIGLRLLLPILLLAGFDSALGQYLMENPRFYQLDAYTSESEAFRAMDFGPRALGDLLLFAEKEKENPYEVLAAFMITNDYAFSGTVKLLSPSTWKDTRDRLLAVKPVEFQKLSRAYESVLKDIQYFPIPNNEAKRTKVAYENSWGMRRTYGGERTHEGCDIMSVENPRGYYPVVSMTDGTVEKLGWLEQGGYRVGIRAPGGGYFYYAHLYSYEEGLVVGKTVRAGELLGYMGDTGYSTIEGTTGNFAVHLHMGIYIHTDHQEEVSVNPYWILKYFERKQLNSWYEG